MPDLPHRSHRGLITLQTAALFRFDADDRMTGTNEPDPGPSPRLFLGRTIEGHIWRFGQDVPNALASELDDILREEPITATLERPPTCLDTLIRLLETQTPITSVTAGPAWVVPADVARSPEIETTSSLSPVHLQEALPIFASDQAPALPYAAVVVDGRVASVCSCSRITDVVAEAGLHTLPEHRGHGYAAAAIASWASAVRATGLIPLYSTSWDNIASRRVAAKLGLVLYGVDLSIS